MATFTGEYLLRFRSFMLPKGLYRVSFLFRSHDQINALRRDDHDGHVRRLRTRGSARQQH